MDGERLIEREIEREKKKERERERERETEILYHKRERFCIRGEREKGRLIL